MVHRITIVVDNQTPFLLEPNGKYTQWGDFVQGPSSVQSYYSNGVGGILQASKAPWVGTAGMVGYQISSPAVWMVMLASDPDWSPEDNRTGVDLSLSSIPVNQDTYNRIWNGSDSKSIPLQKGVLTLSSDIGSADDCVATFHLKWSEKKASDTGFEKLEDDSSSTEGTDVGDEVVQIDSTVSNPPKA